MRGPSPIHAIRRCVHRLGSGRWLGGTRGRGRVGRPGLSLTIQGRKITRLHLVAVLLRFLPLVPAWGWGYRRPDGYRTDESQLVNSLIFLL